MVHWKGILRLLGDDQWQLPPAGQQVKITINDTFGNLIYSELHTVDELGSVYGDFTLAPDGSSGYYTINGELPPPDPAQAAPYSTSYGFTVASYVKPEFEIAVADEPAFLHPGRDHHCDRGRHLLHWQPAGRRPGAVADLRLRLHVQLAGA